MDGQLSPKGCYVFLTCLLPMQLSSSGFSVMCHALRFEKIPKEIIQNCFLNLLDTYGRLTSSLCGPFELYCERANGITTEECWTTPTMADTILSS